MADVISFILIWESKSVDNSNNKTDTNKIFFIFRQLGVLLKNSVKTNNL
jgi:hypothetical protein